MDDNQIVLKYKPWMFYALLAFCSIVFSYILASHIPDCSGCKDPSFIQVWHVIFSVLCLIGAIPLTIASFVVAERDR